MNGWVPVLLRFDQPDRDPYGRGVTRIDGRRWLAAVAAMAVMLVAGCTSSPSGTPGDQQAGGLQTASADPTYPPILTTRPTTQPPSPATNAPHPSATTTAPPVGDAPVHFTTLPPGSKLPTDAQCAAWVRQMTYVENKGVNQKFNNTTGHSVGSSFFSGDTAAANAVIAPRVDGQFTGTTHQILRWAACKWGIDEDLVYAQAAIESWWRQTTLGDWGTDATQCPPGHGLGADGQPGRCPQSWGILQNRFPYEQSGWPGIGTSTAMNADLAYAIWRTCYEGYETWLNTVLPKPNPAYAAGDAWGCIGRWYSGRWHDAGAETYITRVKMYLNQRIWETSNFQEP
jgi:autotransporter family porin